MDYRFFDAASCTACGQCLDRCPYIPLTGDGAAAARLRFKRGEPVDDVLRRCTSCYACDGFCPEGLKPYESILEFWSARYEKTGLPERARFLMPASDPNFRQYMVDRMDADDRRQVDDWAAVPETMTGTVLYPGCNFITLPHLARQPWMEGIAIHGGFGQCCGEMYFRMGMFSEVDRIAEELTAFYAGHDIDEMLFVCPACYNMFTHILPEQFGAEFGFRPRFLTDLLLDRLERGEIAVEKPLEGEVVVHDSCHARVMGDGFLDAQRNLLRALGTTPVEAVADRAAGHCCGIAAGCANHSPVDIAVTALKALDAGRRARAPELTAYCGGCYLVLTMTRLFHPAAPRVRHLLELTAEACGIAPGTQGARRARTGLTGVATKGLPGVLSRNRFRLS